MKILSLFPKSLYDTKMSPGRTMYLGYVGTMPGNSVVWSGKDWPGYENEASVKENVESLESVHRGKFDAVVIYKGQTLIDAAGCDRRKIVIFNEANDENLVNEEIESSGANTVVFHHRSDYDMWRWSLQRRGIRSCNWCHGSPGTVPSVGWKDRKNSVIVTGCLAGDIYPLRSRAAKAIDEGFFRGGVVLRHPSYRLKNRIEVINQYASYLKTLSLSKVAICCTSIYKYPLAKLFEAAMCGCVVATDLPNCPEFEKHLWPHCIRLDASWEPERIAGEISLYTDEDLRERGEALRKISMERFSYRNWADCLISAINEAC